MTFLWVWAYALKFPLSVICGLATVICLFTFAAGLKATNSRNGDGHGQMLLGLNFSIFFAILWAAVYALPSPTYNVVYKDRIVEKPVVKRVISQILTRTITKYPTLDEHIAWCKNNYNKTLEDCTDWARNLEQPHIVVKQVPVRVFAGQKIVPVYPTRDQRVNWCVNNPNLRLDVDQCTDWAVKMEQPKVVIQHDKYMDIYKWCNETYSLDGVQNAGEVRNQRLQICADVALKGSR